MCVCVCVCVSLHSHILLLDFNLIALSEKICHCIHPHYCNIMQTPVIFCSKKYSWLIIIFSPLRLGGNKMSFRCKRLWLHFDERWLKTNICVFRITCTDESFVTRPEACIKMGCRCVNVILKTSTSVQSSPEKRVCVCGWLLALFLWVNTALLPAALHLHTVGNRHNMLSHLCVCVCLSVSSGLYTSKCCL